MKRRRFLKMAGAFSAPIMQLHPLLALATPAALPPQTQWDLIRGNSPINTRSLWSHRISRVCPIRSFVRDEKEIWRDASLPLNPFIRDPASDWR